MADISNKWRVTARNWGTIIGELSFLFPDRLRGSNRALKVCFFLFEVCHF